MNRSQTFRDLVLVVLVIYAVVSLVKSWEQDLWLMEHRKVIEALVQERLTR